MVGRVKKKAATCALCRVKPAAAKTMPFCSERCAQIDLYRWLNGAYSIPSFEQPDELSDESADEQ
ncbi:MAG: DNA gyrase inhibitor YacG [Parvibaculales bacterium]